MKAQINEIKRMQQLAGILKENEGDNISELYGTFTPGEVERTLGDWKNKVDFYNITGEELKGDLLKYALEIVQKNPKFPLIIAANPGQPSLVGELSQSIVSQLKLNGILPANEKVATQEIKKYIDLNPGRTPTSLGQDAESHGGISMQMAQEIIENPYKEKEAGTKLERIKNDLVKAYPGMKF